MLLLALALAAASPARFDLDCVGPANDPTATQYHFRYVVDLEQKVWCKGDETKPCQLAGNIASVTPATITLQNRHEREVSITESIDRSNGLALMLSQIGTSYESQSGFCKRQPFSGFGERQF